MYSADRHFYSLQLCSVYLDNTYLAVRAEAWESGGRIGPLRSPHPGEDEEGIRTSDNHVNVSDKLQAVVIFLFIFIVQGALREEAG